MKSEWHIPPSHPSNAPPPPLLGHLWGGHGSGKTGLQTLNTHHMHAERTMKKYNNQHATPAGSAYAYAAGGHPPAPQHFTRARSSNHHTCAACNGKPSCSRPAPKPKPPMHMRQQPARQRNPQWLQPRVADRAPCGRVGRALRRRVAGTVVTRCPPPALPECADLLRPRTSPCQG